MVNSAMASLSLMHVMVDIVSECNHHVEDRAASWCESLNVPYFRMSPPLDSHILLNETEDSKLIDLMWNAKLYLYKNKHKIEEIAVLLK